MKRLARPTLLLTPSKAPGFSKLGGEPELPEGIGWPVSEGRTSAFLVQLDLAEVRAAGGPEWLPETGALYAFNDDERYGFRDHVQVLFSSDPASRGLTPAPSDLAAKHRFGERRVDFLRLISVPSLDWLSVDPREVDLSDDDLDELADAPNAPFGDELQHRIGGYPSEIQNGSMALACERLARGLDSDTDDEPTPAIERASKEWRLLLQIDSDPALKMNFGDGGRLYVFIKERHARAGVFSKTVSIWQTY
jgi:uncharacterized protein YwqG